MTVEDFAALSASEAEDFELIDGELIPIPALNPMQALVRGRLECALRSYFDRHATGHSFSGVDSSLSAVTAQCPVISIFLGERIHSVDPRQRPVPFSPDVAIEVLGPTDASCHARRRSLKFLAADTREVWQIDYENALVVIQTNDGIRLLRGEAALETPLLPGFSAALSTLLAPF